MAVEMAGILHTLKIIYIRRFSRGIECATCDYPMNEPGCHVNTDFNLIVMT